MDPRELESIRADLGSDDEEVRRLAIERTALLPSEEGLEALVHALGDPSWRVRKASVERLAASDDPERAAGLLVRGLADGENPGRRNAALDALVSSGSSVVPTLLRSTHEPDMDLRKLVVDALAGIADDTATPRLVEMLSDADANVRAAAADALGAIGDPEAEARLVERAAASGEERLVRLSALRALARMDARVPAPELLGVLEDSLLRPAAFALLGRSEDERALQWLTKGLGERSRSSREAAMEALVRVASREAGESLVEQVRSAAGDELVDDAVERLSSANLSTRLTLVQFLGLLGRGETVLPMLRAGADEALQDIVLSTLQGFDAVAEAAVEAGWSELEIECQILACALLARTGGQRGTALLESALDAGDPELRAAAARALGERKAGGALPALLRRLQSAATEETFDDEDELEALTEALVGVAGSPAHASEAVESLVACIPGGGDRVRLAIAETLSRIPFAVESGAMAELLSDPSDDVRRAAVSALGRFPGALLSESIRMTLADESPGVRIAAAAALGAFHSPSVVQDLALLCGDEDPHVRAAAVRAVGQHVATAGLAAKSVRDLLTNALEDEGPVAIAAVEAVRRAGGAAAVKIILPILERPDAELVQTAVGCVAEHGSAEEAQLLIPLVAHPSWAVRAEVIQVLSERGVRSAVPTLLRRLETEQDDFVRDAILRALTRLED